MADNSYIELTIHTSNGDKVHDIQINSPCKNYSDHWYIKELLNKHREDPLFSYDIVEKFGEVKIEIPQNADDLKLDFEEKV